MTKSKRKTAAPRRFALGMLLYALIFLLLTLVGMRLLWSYLAEYEATRLNHAIEAYMSSFDDEHIERIAQPFLSSLGEDVGNREDSGKAVELVMKGALSYRRQSKESNSYRAVFKIYSGEHEAGRVVLSRPDNPPMGFSYWSVEEESYDFPWLLAGDEITVPDGWTVALKGETLGEDALVRTEVPYVYLKDFYGKGLPELYQRTYRVENYIGSAPFELTDSFGRAVSLSERGEDRYLDNCTEAEKEEINGFVEKFMPLYIECLANTRRDARGNYDRIKPYLVENGGLDKRLSGGREGSGYAQTKGEKINSTTVNRQIHLGGDTYLAECTYEIESASKWEAKVTTRQVTLQIILVRTEGKLLAQTLYNLAEVDL